MQCVAIRFHMLNPEDIIRLRNEKGLSQRDLAILLSKFLGSEVSHTIISKWENGKNSPSPSYLKALEEILVYKEDSGIYTETVRSELGIDDSRNISGKWYTEWSYIEKGEIKQNPNYLNIKHEGDVILGVSHTKEFSYEIIAYLLKDSTITGKWYSIIGESSHHGVFMIHLRRNGKKGKGFWIGTYDHEDLDDEKNNDENQDQKFMTGEWRWEKR